MPKSSANSPEDAKTVDHNAQSIDPMMLKVLVCPKTHAPLIYDRDAAELISKKARLAYPIREGVPILLVEEARPLK